MMVMMATRHEHTSARALARSHQLPEILTARACVTVSVQWIGQESLNENLGDAADRSRLL